MGNTEMGQTVYRSLVERYTFRYTLWGNHRSSGFERAYPAFTLRSGGILKDDPHLIQDQTLRTIFDDAINVELQREGVIIGREPSIGLIVNSHNQYISKTHGKIDFQMDDLWYHDLSTNGSIVEDYQGKRTETRRGEGCLLVPHAFTGQHATVKISVGQRFTPVHVLSEMERGKATPIRDYTLEIILRRR